jgi:hypothetical protein
VRLAFKLAGDGMTWWRLSFHGSIEEGNEIRSRFRRDGRRKS